MEYREGEGGMRGHPIPLISAEGELCLWYKPRQGAKADLVFQFSNPILTGNTAGLSTFMRVPWRRALEFATALIQPETGAAAKIRRGEGVVIGYPYAPIRLDLNPMCFQRVFLTADDCETIAHVVTECVVAATGRNEIRKAMFKGVK